MGRYVPPEHEGTTSANKLAGKHALGSRARKSGQGILTVRFEMPFAIWCTSCPKPNIIGQGVRFNAEKKKVDSYYTTPIYSFRMKHVACGGWIEIRTDPKNTAYVVTEGAKKRDTGEDKVEEGEIRFKTDEERDKLANDAFAALEGKIDDKRQAFSDKSRIEELQSAKDRDWSDPAEANRKLRKTFRAERKIRQENAGRTEELKQKMSLGMDLLEETEEDKRRAGSVEFGDINNDGAVTRAKSRPLFAQPSMSTKVLTNRLRLTTAAVEAGQRQERLRKELGNNTRVVLDPFLIGDKPGIPSTRRRSFIKRKRSSTELSRANPDIKANKCETHVPPPALVNYDSD